MPIWKQRLLSRLQAPADDDTSTGGGGGPVITPEMQAVIDARISEATKGLKAKNDELLGTLRTTKDTLKKFDGIDPEAVNAMLRRFADDEEQGLIKAGKIDEVLTKRTERMQAEYAKTVKAEKDAREKAEGKAAKLAARTLAGAIRDAAIKSGALPEAMEDIVLRSAPTWRLNDDGEPVAMNGDEVVYGKDGKTPLTPTEWAESLRETAPHLWPKAQGTNAPGSGSGQRGQAKGNLGGTREERMAAIKSRFPELNT